MNMNLSLSAMFSNSHTIGLIGIFQFIFTNSHIWVDTNTKTHIYLGMHPQPDVTITISEANLLNILDGSANIEQLYASGNLEIDGNLGLATLLPQLIYDQPDSHYKQETVSTNERYPARKRFSELISLDTQINEIERITQSELSIENFRSKYMCNGAPLIISDAIQDWPISNISKQKSLEYFSELRGITRNGNYADLTFSTKRKFNTVSMVNFIKSLDNLEDPLQPGDLPPYMGNNILPRKLLHLINYPPYFERTQYVAPRVWIGPKNTLTPLHRDDVDNLFVQVWGSKSFILAAPHNRGALGTWSTSPNGGLDGCDFDPEKPDYGVFPDAQNIKFLKLELRAGEMLFLPEGWFHQVRSLSSSLSINFWTNSFRCLEARQQP